MDMYNEKKLKYVNLPAGGWNGVKMFGLVVFNCSTCVLTVCPSSPDVCKLRLDFDTFVLADPVQVTPSIIKLSRDKSMNQISIKTPIPKCRPFLKIYQ